MQECVSPLFETYLNTVGDHSHIMIVIIIPIRKLHNLTPLEIHAGEDREIETER